jgi:hypothetical protein
LHRRFGYDLGQIGTVASGEEGRLHNVAVPAGVGWECIVGFEDDVVQVRGGGVNPAVARLGEIALEDSGEGVFVE